MNGRNRSIRTLSVVVIFVAITCIDAGVLWRTRDRHLGVHEDHFDKGVLLYETGSMSSGTKPMVFRPPGYPAFVAATLFVRDALVTITRPLIGDVAVSPGGGKRVTALAAQAVLLGVLAAAIFWFAVDRASFVVAAGCAIGVACNPLLLVLAGHVSYELLHLVIITISTLMLVRIAGTMPPSAAAIFGNGLIWGAATLVKSVTLIAPAFLLVWGWFHYGLRRASRTTAYFTAGLLLVVAPYTIRNYAVTGRFIPVNEQASFALWATSLERIPAGTNYQQWVSIWFKSAMPTYTEMTGEPEYALPVFEDHVLELSDRFRVMARENLRRDPMVYAYNASHNGVMFLIDSPASFFFSRYAWPRDGAARFIAALSLWLMMIVAVIAIVAGNLQRDARWTLILALFTMMWAAHALTFLEARYLYVKLPTIIAGFVFACVVAGTSGSSIWRRAAVGVATSAAVLSVVGLFAL